MDTRWTSLVVAGTIGLMLSGQVFAQPWGGGPGRGRGFGRGQGMGMMAERPGPMGRGMGPAGDGVCPLGLEPGTGRTLGCPLGMEPGTGRALGCPLGPGFGRFAGRLELTDEQRALIADIYEQARPQALEIQEIVLEARIALQHAVANNDMDAIREAASLLGNVIGNRAALHARTKAAVREVLTPAQVQELEQVQSAVPQFRGGMRGRGMGPGFGARRWVPEQ